jgi:hypothetical protein
MDLWCDQAKRLHASDATAKVKGFSPDFSGSDHTTSKPNTTRSSADISEIASIGSNNTCHRDQKNMSA